jgi:hypothetical protein
MPDSGAIKNYYACFPHSATVDTRAATAGNARGDGCGRPGDRGERSLFFPRKFFGLRPDLVLTEEASDALQEAHAAPAVRPDVGRSSWAMRSRRRSCEVDSVVQSISTKQGDCRILGT